VKTRRWDFISDHRADFGVKRLCQVLGAPAPATAGTGPEEARVECQALEAAAVAEIRAIHAEHRGAHGAPRVHAELEGPGTED
jgi:putative transposase